MYKVTRILCLDLTTTNKSFINEDEFKKSCLPLEEMTSDQLDIYISSNFEDSSEIRTKYQKEITKFLTENEKSRYSNLEGKIIIYEPSIEAGTVKYYRRKVLYKMHIKCAPEIMQNKKLMEYFFKKYKDGLDKNYPKLFDTVVFDGLTNLSNLSKKSLENIVANIKKSGDYYGVLRIIYKFYDDKFADFGLLPLDFLYNKLTTKQEYELMKKRKKSQKKSLKSTVKSRKSNIPTDSQSGIHQIGFEELKKIDDEVLIPENTEFKSKKIDDDTELGPEEIDDINQELSNFYQFDEGNMLDLDNLYRIRAYLKQGPDGLGLNEEDDLGENSKGCR